MSVDWLAPDTPGSWYATLELYRTPEGSMKLKLIDMPSHVIEASANPRAAMLDLADRIEDALPDLIAQAAGLE